MKTNIKLEPHDQHILDWLTFSETADKLGFTEQREISLYVCNNLIELYHKVLFPLLSKLNGFKVNSGYRCERTNDAVGGVRLSQHRLGQAADITCDNLRDIWEILQTMDIDQCIKYKNFIHVSYVSKEMNRHQYIDKCLIN